MTLNDQASRELDELLYPFYYEQLPVLLAEEERVGQPLESVKPDNLLPVWATTLLVVSLLVLMCAGLGCLCALITRAL